MEYDRPDKEGISTARSFGVMETELAPMEEALATYVANAALKLRAQRSVCSRIFVFCHTSRFAVVENLYSAGLDVKIDVPTNDTAVLIKAALGALREQVDTAKTAKLQKALKVIDQLNQNYGKDTIRYAAMGFEKKWFMKQEFLSRRFTTRLEEVIVVQAK